VRVNKLGVGDYQAPDYDALVDHPVELGAFWKGTFTVKGVRHEFVVAGAPADFDGDKLLQDTRRICEAQIAFWHGRRKVPFDHYVFMLNAVDDGYGGLEHRQSTALICSRKDLPRLGRAVHADNYTTLLGLISHEYFHTWNVKRLKPTEFAPYDYTRENHTRMLWFFEGFTSYYDDQFLLRAKLIDAAAYLKLVGKTVNQVLATPGRAQYSVGQASFDAWTRYYRPDENTANATVSYYTKGSLIALCLDLALRQLPPRGDREPTLDGVMQRLWALGRAIQTGDVAQALADEADAPPPLTLTGKLPKAAAEQATLHAWAHLLNLWTEGCEDLPLQPLLAHMGVHWSAKPAPLAQRLGTRLSDAGGAVKVQAVMRHSPAEQAGLSAGDELLALDGWRLKRNDDLASWLDESRSQSLLVSRDARVLTLTLPALKPAGAKGQKAASPAFHAEIVNLALQDAQAVQQQGVATASGRKAWLGQ
jgi:predicted metalloprotease with PDZ domain